MATFARCSSSPMSNPLNALTDQSKLSPSEGLVYTHSPPRLPGLWPNQTVSTTPTPFNGELKDCLGLRGQCYPCKQNIPLFLCSGLVRGKWERMRSVCSGIKEGPAAAFGATKGRVSCLLLVLFLGRLRVRQRRKCA
ncbi:unnamed protein product [Tetraodon nigroviridis]|uniref:(spotted green pufferfish) hypothetical protein n=1 Tax=Tetraodon nigroviridis TaxID=99883 RepID=Q4S507_TETNG|nr:unnamed protein product [Tetraodon nigroviridis]